MTEDSIVRHSADATLVLVALSLATAATVKRDRGRQFRVLWTAAWLAYVVHVVAAFALVHDWSHAAAWRHTAERTRAVIGLDWGGGLLINDLFTAAWTADVARRWLRPQMPWHRWLATSWWALFAVVAFNASVVFARAEVRWASLGALVVLACLAALCRD